MDKLEQFRDLIAKAEDPDQLRVYLWSIAAPFSILPSDKWVTLEELSLFLGGTMGMGTPRFCRTVMDIVEALNFQVKVEEGVNLYRPADTESLVFWAEADTYLIDDDHTQEEFIWYGETFAKMVMNGNYDPIAARLLRIGPVQRAAAPGRMER